MTREVAVEVKGIHKRYGGIHALDNVDLQIYEGEVCALLGENGAGKSTLIKILTGVTQKDEGDILLYGEPVHISDPFSAKTQGITAIYQELSLIENLTVAQNIFLGHEPVKTVFGFNDNRALLREASAYLKKFQIDIDPSLKVSELGLGEKRIIEILKAVSVNARILFLDEPTTGMSQAEIDNLFQIIHELKSHHVTMIYISHHLDEVFQVCDRIAVLRDGKNSGVFNVDEVDTPTLVRTMIGRELNGTSQMAYESQSTGEPVLEVSDFQAEEMLQPVSFTLHAGEILGITGIIGAGKSELGMALFGVSKQQHGTLTIKGQQVELRSTRDARQHGIALIPEDRKNQGLFLVHSVENNLSVSNLEQVTTWGTFVQNRRRRELSTDIARKMHVVPLNLRMLARNLSGGNQQKVVIGKWLLGDPDILIMDEPTRGIDVGAKAEIYNLIRSLAKSGKAVLLLSSELEEIQRVCDRIMVLRDGGIAAEFKYGEATNDELLLIALEGKDGH